ncbi:DUF2066 domain-containing protein [Lysobacter sp.]|uniref:DUF2066 domain-containing protein n=1 Tax=Lysobacter sp. TaxID=72226 RepID=UPI002D349E18|nr:DUF2066 domain-containing protein [Lysobacter sp.]HZX78503.1 DUF2066 domain-containing protein [Lysobacter sp.]
MVRAIRTGNPRTRRGIALLRQIHGLAITAVLLLASFAATAQRVEGDRARAEGIYATEVRVNGQGEAERNGAFARALAQVLGKLSGDRSVASRPGVGQELRQARTYVEGYDYRQDEGLGPTGAPSFNTMLVVRFDEEAVNDLIATLGIPIWPQPRPKPVLWLAIDDGSGPRLVGLPQVNAARPALNRAVERGYKLGLPAGNAAEQAAVGAIWRGDSAAVARASARYSPPMQLIGKLYRDATAGWKADWTFVDAGKVLANWSQTGADARQLMASGADGAADALMKRYAKRAPTGEPGAYRVTFAGVDSSDDFIRLAAYLQKLSVVRRATPVRATPQGLEYELDLVSGLPGLHRLLGRDGVVDVLEGLEGQPPVYRLR